MFFSKQQKCVFSGFWDESIDRLVDRKVIQLDVVASNLEQRRTGQLDVVVSNLEQRRTGQLDVVVSNLKQRRTGQPVGRQVGQ